MDSFSTSRSSQGLHRLSLQCAFVVAVLCLHAVFAPSSVAQQVGDEPPAESIRAAGTSDTGEAPSASGLKVSGFMFLDKNGNNIYEPGMTYEQWVQLRDGDSAEDATANVFVFDPMKITGNVNGQRAELDVEMKINVAPTGGRLVSIPLEMKNFRLLRSAEFTSTPNAGPRDLQLIDAKEGGLELKVRSQRRRKLTLRMSFSSLVESGATGLLKFDLPNIPAIVRLDMDAADLVGEILGNRDVPVVAKKTKDGRTQFNFEIAGEEFLLQWGANQADTEPASLLEVESQAELSWGSPQDQPIATVLMNIVNLRERGAPIDEIKLRLPNGAVLQGLPILKSSNQSIQVTQVDSADDRLIMVSIPTDERSNRIALQLKLQLESIDATAEKPFDLSVPLVPDALRQKGDIKITTSSDFQLRWRTSDWIRSFIGAPSDDPATRSYQFRFHRGDFRLPVWLIASQRQLRLNSDSVVKVGDPSATIEMQFEFAGQATDSRTLRLDMAGWSILSVIDAETEETLPWLSDEFLSIDINTQADQPPPIRIVASKDVTQDGAVDFELPRVIKSDQRVTFGNQFVTLQGSRRSAMVVDLSRSTGIERSPLPVNGDQPKPRGFRYRVTANGVASRVVGGLAEQPPQITLASNAHVRKVGTTLMTTVDWNLTPQVDLVGSLAVRVPGLAATAVEPRSDVDEAIGLVDRVGAIVGDALPEDLANQLSSALDLQRDDEEEDIDGERSGQSTGQATANELGAWTVTVNEVAARLRPLSGDRYELQSDLLGVEPVVIRWRKQSKLPESRLVDQLQVISLPAPAIADVTILGEFDVTLAGDSTSDLVAADSRTPSVMKFSSLPDEVRLRLAKRTSSQSELAIRKAVLRSAIGKTTRHEQLLAQVQGGETLDLGIPGGIDEIYVDAFVDQQRRAVTRDRNRLRISLPGDNESHTVDVRVWVDEPAEGLVTQIEPTLQLPIRAGRVYWQITTPRDRHVVWAAPTIERAMNWRFERWRLSRQPALTDASLTQWVGIRSANSLPKGNQYLYIGADVRSFQARTMTRAWLWFLVGGLVLGLAWLLTYVPAARSPLTAVAAALVFAGLLAVAPDAAVLAGQLGMIALVLVVVMYAVRALVQAPASDRILTTKAAPAETPSGQAPTVTREVSPNIPATHSLEAAASGSEVSSS